MYKLYIVDLERKVRKLCVYKSVDLGLVSRICCM